MGTVVSTAPIVSVGPSAPDPTIAPTPAGPVIVVAVAVRMTPTGVPTQFKYYHIAFPIHTNMTPTVTSVAAPFPAVLGGAPMGPSQPAKGAVKHLVSGQMMQRILDALKNNGILGNSAGLSTPSQVTIISMSP